MSVPLKGSFIPGSPSATCMQVTCCCLHRFEWQPQDAHAYSLITNRWLLIRHSCALWPFNIFLKWGSHGFHLSWSPLMWKRQHLVQIPDLWSASCLLTAHIDIALTQYLCPKRRMRHSFLPSAIPLSLRPFLPCLLTCVYPLWSSFSTVRPSPARCAPSLHTSSPLTPLLHLPIHHALSGDDLPPPSRDNYNKSCEDGLVFKQLNKHGPGADGPRSTTLREKMRRGREAGGGGIETLLVLTWCVPAADGGAATLSWFSAST